MKKAAAKNNTEVFLEYRRMKKWIDKKSGYNCFMLYSRSLLIWWAESEYWIWDCFKETGDENIEVAKLSHVCWLEVRGKLKTSELTPEVEYEAVYVVKLTKGAFGWERPIKLTLIHPDGKVQERQMSILIKPREEWMELNLGSFEVKKGETRELWFHFSQIGGQWKSGLVIKGVIVRPKHLIK